MIFFLALVAIFGFITMLCMPVRAFDASTRFLRPSAPAMHQFSGPIGKFSDFTLSGVILMTSGVLAVDFASIRPMGLSVRPLGASALFPGL